MVRIRCGHHDGIVVRQWWHEYPRVARGNDHDAVFDTVAVKRRRDLPRRQLSDAARQLQGKASSVAMRRHEQDENIVVLVHDIGNGVYRRREIVKIGQRYGIHRLAAIDEFVRCGP